MKTRILFTVALALGIVATSQAQFAFVSTRAGIGENDFIDWGQFGGSYTNIGSPVNGTSNDGNQFQVTGPGAGQQIRVQGSSWSGNFNDSDNLLYSEQAGTTSLVLGATVHAIGFNVEANLYGTYTAFIAAYDGLGNLLGSGVYSANGTSTGGDDGSALFVGLTTGSNYNSIGTIKFSCVDAAGAPIDYAINRVSINGCSSVPEPASVAALGIGAIALLRRRRK